MQADGFIAAAGELAGPSEFDSHPFLEPLDFMREPIESIRQVCGWPGELLTADVEQAMLEWLTEDRRRQAAMAILMTDRIRSDSNED